MPVATQMQLDEKPYSKEDLKMLVSLLVTRMNDIDSISRVARTDITTNDSIFVHAAKSYSRLGMNFPSLTYKNPSVKSSFYGMVANYLGFSGYYA